MSCCKFLGFVFIFVVFVLEVQEFVKCKKLEVFLLLEVFVFLKVVLDELVWFDIDFVELLFFVDCFRDDDYDRFVIFVKSVVEYG